METVCSSEMQVNLYQTARRHVHSHRCENFKCNIARKFLAKLDLRTQTEGAKGECQGVTENSTMRSFILFTIHYSLDNITANKSRHVVFIQERRNAYKIYAGNILGKRSLEC
jgi:hypothetical protein